MGASPARLGHVDLRERKWTHQLLLNTRPQAGDQVFTRGWAGDVGASCANSPMFLFCQQECKESQAVIKIVARVISAELLPPMAGHCSTSIFADTM